MGVTCCIDWRIPRKHIKQKRFCGWKIVRTGVLADAEPGDGAFCYIARRSKYFTILHKIDPDDRPLPKQPETLDDIRHYESSQLVSGYRKFARTQWFDGMKAAMDNVVSDVQPLYDHSRKLDAEQAAK